MKGFINSIIITTAFSSFINAVFAAELPADISSAIDKAIPALTAIAIDQKTISAVKQCNTNPSPETVSMTNDKWKTLSILSPEVKAFAKNDLAQYLNKNKPIYVTELFVSAADGSKVAFISKPTNWSHKGKPKHDLPMQGKKWTGEIEVDESTGLQQIQVALPVLDNKKPIGSIVFGLSIAKLKENK
jgi:hypothetical protein